MKFPRFNELEKLPKQELFAKLGDLKKQLIKINAQIAMGTVPENPGAIKPLKKTIAKIQMLLACQNSGDRQGKQPKRG
ncbi:50S ribosomal protein L29 [archaeon]|nr:50S ribosomal protein L29 [archaeon]